MTNNFTRMAITTYLSPEQRSPSRKWYLDMFHRPLLQGYSLVFHSALLCAQEAEASPLVAAGLRDPIPTSTFLPQSVFHGAVLVLPPLGDNGSSYGQFLCLVVY